MAAIEVESLARSYRTGTGIVRRRRFAQSRAAILSGASVDHSSGLLLTELAVGIAYAIIGKLLLKLFEFESTRTASLETF